MLSLPVLVLYFLFFEMFSSFQGSMTSLREKTEKSVRFQKVTIYSFGRLQGFSGIPSQDGPTLGKAVVTGVTLSVILSV